MDGKLKQSVTKAFVSAKHTAWWMIKITFIVSLSVSILQYVGLIASLSKILSPFFVHIGLSGESVLAYLSAYCVNIYSAIAVIDTLDLSYRSITILGLMCLCSHNMFIETAVQKKTGSPFWRMFIIRTLSAFLCAYVANILMPQSSEIRHASISSDAAMTMSFGSYMWQWFVAFLKLCIKMLCLIIGLTITQRILADYGIIKWIARIFRPILYLFGLPAKTSFLWIVANTLGLAYGSAVMIEECEAGKISKRDADLLNHHIAVSHSNVEDLLLFVSVGANVLWLLGIRLVLAWILVWERRLETIIVAHKNKTIHKNAALS